MKDEIVETRIGIKVEAKKCLNCGKDIPINYDKLSEYKKRKFCCVSCATTYNNKKRKETRFCLNCGIQLEQNQAKKYCSIKCQQEYQQKQWEDKWLSGKIDGFSETNHWGTVPKRIRRYLFKKYNSKCARCGWGEINPYSNKVPLEVEHIDGDYKNNRPENLTLLCPNCHSLTRTYRGLNVGHGRGKTWMPIPDEDIAI